MRKEAALAGIGAIALLALVWVVITKTRPANGPRAAADEVESESGEGSRARGEWREPTRTAAAASARAATPVATVDRTVVDKARRDDMRRRILEGLWASDPNAANAASGGAAPPPRDDRPLDKEYIQERVREDFFPMAKQCYEELLARKPSAAGRFVVKFKIVGDEKVGGVVDEAEVDPSSTLVDEKMSTCLRESMLAMAFKPPHKGGSVTVTYPIQFSPGDAAPP